MATSKRPQAGSAGEEWLSIQLRTIKVATPHREFKFHPTRRWRFDFAWPDQMIAVEVEGGHWNGGRHTRGAGFEKDCEKYSEAALLGYRVFRFTTKMVTSGYALSILSRALRTESEP